MQPRGGARCADDEIIAPPAGIDRSLEILHRPELAIDTRKAQIGDLVQLAERAQDGNANLIGRYFGLTQGPKRIFDQLPQAS